MPGTEPSVASRSATSRGHQRSGPGTADLAAIAVGGGIGSVARYLLSVLIVYLLEVRPPRRLLRPFLAVGLIGGYTTFSTYAAGVMTLLTGRAFALADAYALSSVVAALVAVWCGVKAARAMAGLPARSARARRSGEAG